MIRFGQSLAILMQFFSTIPIKREIPMTDKNVARAIGLFPLFGLLLGIVYAGIGYSLFTYTPLSTLAITFVLWLWPIVITGGIHLDGWMDTSDAFFSYQEQTKRLDILQDSRVGAFGVLSVIVLLTGRFVFIYDVMAQMPVADFWLLIALIPVYSRLLMGMTLLTVPSAKQSGLGHFFQKALSPSIRWYYVGFLGLLFIGLMVYAWKWGLLAFIILLIVGLGFFYMRRKMMNWFGGMTGDIIGAVCEGVEIVLWLILWVLHYFVTG